MTDVKRTDVQREASRDQELQELVGKTISGKYAVTRLIGKGGMGAVYEAENLGIGKMVALKFIDREFAKDETVASRFAREARAASSIESAHIVTVFDAGTDDGRPFLVMELLRGEDLGTRLRRLGRIPVADALHVVAQVLRGLGRAHASGIIHRDLKPDNVFLVQSDGDPLFAKIVDFGISKIQRASSGTAPLALTQKGTVIGTPLYMSPEQAQALPDIDGRADLYSVGAILFECLAGAPPHTGANYEQVILSICMNDAPDLRTFNGSVPEPVAQFVARALDRDRTRRYPSASHMLAALHDIAPDERLRVPLDSMPGTLVTGAGGKSDSRSPRNTVMTGPATDVSWSSVAPPKTGPGAEPRPTASRSGLSRAAVPLTAFFAMVIGVGLTVWIAGAMRPPAGPTNVPTLASETRTTASGVGSAMAPAVAPPVIAASLEPARSGPVASATATAPQVEVAPRRRPAPVPAPLASPAGQPAVKQPAPAATKPVGSALDLQRELP